MAEKRCWGDRWTYPVVSVLFHLFLILALSRVPLADGERPQRANPVPVHLRWAAWSPPESAQPERPAEKRGSEETGKRGSPMEGAGVVSPLPRSLPARSPDELRQPSALLLGRPKQASVPVPPEVIAGETTAPQGSIRAPAIDLRSAGEPDILSVPSPSLPASGAPDPEPTAQKQEPVEEGRESRSAGSQADLALAEPRYRENDKPAYPRLARLKGYQGTVVLKVEVHADGRVGEVIVKQSSRHKILDEAAVKAVREWLFSPAKRGGVSVASWVVVPIQFELVAE